MKLLSLEAERNAIRGLCSEDARVSGLLLGSVREEHFHSGSCREGFKRILRQAKNHGEVPTFDELKTDPALSEQTRKFLAKIKEPERYTKKGIKKLTGTLEQFRQIRSIYFHSKEMLEELSKDKIDLAELIDKQSEVLTHVRSTTSKAKVHHFGKGNNLDKVVKELLLGDRPPVVPTGFKAWDDTNGGFLPGSMVLLASTTGGGKSTMANAILKNQAKRGHKVCLVPLEMDVTQTFARTLSDISKIKVGEIVQKKLTKNERNKVWKDYKRTAREIEELDGRFSLFVPDHDMTLEEMLFVLKPYNFGTICIDYISLIKGVGTSDNSVKALGEIARAAKVYAVQTGTTIILCGQLSDEGKVKYARAIAENADVAWLWDYTDENRETGLIDIRTAKSRNLVPLNFQLGHDYSTMSIYDVEDGATNYGNSTQDDDETESSTDRKGKKHRQKGKGRRQDSGVRHKRTSQGDKKRARLDRIEGEINLPAD